MAKHTNIPASFLIIEKDNKILLLRRYNTGYEDGNYSLIAGHVEPNESFTQCIIREAKEEADIILQAKDLKVAHIMHANTNSKDGNNEWIFNFFVTNKRTGKIVNKEPNKCDDLSWFDIDNLPHNIIPNVKKALEAIKNNKFYSEIGWDNG